MGERGDFPEISGDVLVDPVADQTNLANGLEKAHDPLGVKIGTVVLAFGSGWIAQKLVGAIWKKVTGNAAPQDVDDEDVSIVSAVAFAAVSAGVGVLTRRLAHRGAVKLFIKWGKEVSPQKPQ